MPESENFLMIEFLSWVADRRRTYSEAMDAWQSHCPRQTIWEDAMIGGYVKIDRRDNCQDPEILLTASGKALLNGRADHA